MYEAASRAVMHQREPDGTKKAQSTQPSQAVAFLSAGTASVYSHSMSLELVYCAMHALQYDDVIRLAEQQCKASLAVLHILPIVLCLESVKIAGCNLRHEGTCWCDLHLHKQNLVIVQLM